MKAKKKTVAKSTKQAARPLRKRMLLHPFTVMVLLCAGVLIVGSTFVSYAASYNVTATVPASLPGAPAVIAHPLALQHLSSPMVNINGTCPNGAYAKVYVNSSFSGVSTCSDNSFQVQTSLVSGANSLQAKVYNMTDQEGPASDPITVYYDPTPETPTVPAGPPATISIQNIESGSYHSGAVEEVSSRPTISGFAPPFSTVVVTFHSVISTCKTVADAAGWWTCTLANGLPPGLHHVDIAVTTQAGALLSFPTFQVLVSDALPVLIKSLPSPIFVNADYTYQTHYAGEPFTWTVGLNGGAPPYAVNVVWGDTSETSLPRANGSAFTITHAFPAAKTYVIYVKATDTKGATSTIQLAAVVKGIGEPIAAIHKPSPFDGVLTSVKRYLWIVWPVYIGVVLMAFSYWLGEQEMYQRLFRRRRLAHHMAGRGRKL